MTPKEIYRLPEWIGSFWNQHEKNLCDSIYSPEMFGNFCLVFKFGNSKLRIVRDRLIVSVEVMERVDGSWVELWPLGGGDEKNNWGQQLS